MPALRLLWLWCTERGNGRMITLTIDGIRVETNEGSTILEAAASAGIRIPTLCYLKEVNEIGSCRVCVVEVEGMEKLVPSCNTLVKEGMKVQTMSEKVVAARKLVLDLLLANHHRGCFSCPQNGACELQDLCYEYGIEESSFAGTRKKIETPVKDSHPFLSYHPELCIHCQRCVSTCAKVTGRHATLWAKPVCSISLRHHLERTGRIPSVSPAETVPRRVRPVPSPRSGKRNTATGRPGVFVPPARTAAPDARWI